jgi:tetratricopeptide (TPR) repeat protein
MSRLPLLALAAALACASAQKPASPAPEAPASAPGAPAPPRYDAEALRREASAKARDAFDEGVGLARAGACRDAAEAFDEARALDPDLAWAAFDAAAMREAAGDDARALAGYRALLARDPAHDRARRNLVRLRIRLGQADAVLAELTTLVDRDPDAPGPRLERAEALLAAGRLDGAEADARRVLKTAEREVRAMVVLASVYQARQRWELARMVLDNARQVDERSAAVWNRLGLVRLAAGERAEALEAFRTAAELDPEYVEALVNLGAVLVEIEDFPAAAARLEDAVRIAPRLAAGWLDLGNAYRGSRRFDEARGAYDRALALDASMAEATFGLALLHLDVEREGMAAAERLEKAIAYLDAYQRAGGTDPRLAAYRKDAVAQLERERKRLAREEKEKARKAAATATANPVSTASASPSPSPPPPSNASPSPSWSSTSSPDPSPSSTSSATSTPPPTPDAK